ncbi:ABC transporter substrate-binding protein [Thermostichus vulcanus]|uniref:ABC transporter substrate-binding protein n=1 Tax=Thermostichus vulcanus str. 'Rupite' TaxID=2813851 RepID=A0ABT0CFH6_THEVL|nr:ABC transporter substrate-binding protein [Thermostichus vulcanus]MCJ2544533.1 ABC transporter substrate-binding protein [Thermostichus vulcanus str. 'Rupite']
MPLVHRALHEGHQPLLSTEIPQLPQRLVSLTPTGFDILAELELPSLLSPGSGSYFFPDFQAIAQVKPDLILACEFPHRAWLWRLQRLAPVYLLAIGGLETACQNLIEIARLTGRVDQAQRAIDRLCGGIKRYSIQLAPLPKPTVLMMGGSWLNVLTRRLIIETEAGALGSILKDLAYYPWGVSTGSEPGIGFASLRHVLQVNPDVIFVQSYPLGPWRQTSIIQQLAKLPEWRQLRAAQSNRIFEVDPFWHQGSGTRSIRLMLKQVLPFIYPEQTFEGWM